jgi:aryl-alcohol dehydrogenase-like predicted oxidoreductase
MRANEAILATVRSVADRRDATPGQVALAWDVAQGDRVVPIPGTKRLERIAENAGAADLELSAEDLESLDRLPDPVGNRY